MEEVLKSPELLEKIFSYLGSRDIKTVSRVSRNWKSVSDVPKFWTWAKIRLSTYNFLKEWQNNERIRMLARTIIFEGWNGGVYSEQEEEYLCLFFDRLINGEVELDFVDFSDVCLSDIDYDNDFEKLAKGLAKIKEVKIHYPYRSEYIMENLDVVVKEIAETDDLKLQKLSIANNFLDYAAPELLASAAVKLEELVYKFEHNSLDEKHIHAIINKIAETGNDEMKLKRLDLNDPSHFSSIEPPVLTSAFVKTDVILENSFEDFTPIQLQDIFKAIAADEAISYKIENLGYGIELNHASPGDLATVIVRQKKFNFENKTALPEQHMEAVLSKIVETKELQLKEITMGKFSFPNSVDSNLLSQAFIKMESVELVSAEISPSNVTNAKVSKQKLENLFTTIANTEEVNLKKLYIMANYSKLKPDLFSRAISKLEVARLYLEEDEKVSLTPEQVHGIFKVIAEDKTNLKELNIRGSNVSKVPPKLLSEAAVKLEILNLTESGITEDQMVAMFEKIVKSKELKLEEFLYLDNVLMDKLEKSYKNLVKQVRKKIHLIRNFTMW